MPNDVIGLKLGEFRGTFRTWWDKRRDDQRIEVNRKREQYIRILQKRYGYTKEKAALELNTRYSKARLD